MLNDRRNLSNLVEIHMFIAEKNTSLVQQEKKMLLLKTDTIP